MLTGFLALRYGAGRHDQALALHGLVPLFKAVYYFELLWALAIAFVKYSMYAFLILPPTTRT